MVEFAYRDDRYQPGVCNIGPAEIRRRRQLGWAGLISAVALGVLLLLIGAPAIARLLVAVPLVLAFSGFLQAHLHFCAGFGMRGLRNLGALGEAEAVEDDADRMADRRRAMLINVASGIGALLVAIAFFLLPV